MSSEADMVYFSGSVCGSFRAMPAQASAVHAINGKRKNFTDFQLRSLGPVEHPTPPKKTSTPAERAASLNPTMPKESTQTHGRNSSAEDFDFDPRKLLRRRSSMVVADLPVRELKKGEDKEAVQVPSPLLRLSLPLHLSPVSHVARPSLPVTGPSTAILSSSRRPTALLKPSMILFSFSRL